MPDNLLVISTPGLEKFGLALLKCLGEISGFGVPSAGFFTPGANSAPSVTVEALIARGFGGPTSAAARLIASAPDDAVLDHVIGALAPEGLLDVECYAPNRIEAFRRAGFHVVALFERPSADTLAPEDLEGFRRIYASAREAGEITGETDSEVRRAFLWCWKHVLAAGAPIIRLETLRNGCAAEIADTLADAGLEAFAPVGPLAEAIIEKRASGAFGPLGPC